MESEHPVTGLDTAISPGITTPVPGRVSNAGKRQEPRNTRTFQAVGAVTKSVGELDNVRYVRREIGVAKFPHLRQIIVNSTRRSGPASYPCQGLLKHRTAPLTPVITPAGAERFQLTAFATALLLPRLCRYCPRLSIITAPPWQHELTETRPFVSFGRHGTRRTIRMQVCRWPFAQKAIHSTYTGALLCRSWRS